MDRKSYDEGIYKIINDKTKFRKLSGDITVKREGQLQRFLRRIKDTGFLSDTLYDNIYPSGSNPARIYGLPKLHKSFTSNGYPSFRSIVSSIGTYNYNLSKFLCTLLTPLIPSSYSTEDSFTFVKEINKVSLKDSFIVSYDVCSLFTNIPLEETINLAVNLIFEKDPNIKISREDLKQLFLFATAQTHFIFKGDFYDQIDGVPMGTPLAPVLANLFMGYNESIWLNEYSLPPILYKRYVDDIITAFRSENEADNFLEFLNSRHPNIKFTMEKQQNNKISFLDVHLDNSENLITKIFRKKTFTGILTNYYSFTSFTYKKGLINCLVERAFKINNTWKFFHSDLNDVKNILLKNGYPSIIFDKIIKTKIETLITGTNKKQDNRTNTRYFKLPYLGKQSENLNKKLLTLSRKYCKSVSFKIAFTSTKIKSFFSAKDSLPSYLKSFVIYKFKCAGCNSCYIGETTRHLDARIDEHLRKDKKSAIYKHIHKNIGCFDNCKKTCFSVLDTANTKFQLKVKEGMYIGWENPDVNKQVKYVKCSLIV